MVDTLLTNVQGTIYVSLSEKLKTKATKALEVILPLPLINNVAIEAI